MGGWRSGDNFVESVLFLCLRRFQGLNRDHRACMVRQQAPLPLSRLTGPGAGFLN